MDHNGQVRAWVDWANIDMDAPMSGGERRILELARSLAGVMNTQPLGELLSSLDDGNLDRVLWAVELTCRGQVRGGGRSL